MYDQSIVLQKLYWPKYCIKSKQRCMTKALHYKSKQWCMTKVLYYKSKQTKEDVWPKYCITKVNKDDYDQK